MRAVTLTGEERAASTGEERREIATAAIGEERRVRAATNLWGVFCKVTIARVFLTKLLNNSDLISKHKS